ncbi:MAG: DUF2946 family protein [Burkholderiaceae bacterium]
MADCASIASMFSGRPFSRSATLGRQLLLWLTVAAFACRAFLPVGFMPDAKALQSGKLVLTLCVAGGGTQFTTVDLPDASDDTEGQKLSPTDNCPFGLIVSQAMMPAAPMPVLPAAQVSDLPARFFFRTLPALAAQGPPLGSRAPPPHLA